ncbi:hotdog fold thioesterase [Uruburuella testudinis]|uniref:Hotdog fold thioesterase n=1 Tax=Uruburuella testudinis TaxID=1282863 RepID=A0ABY4DYB5_9NEIS|nr:hotdog domain-containing protein [Uruburuella testudinis]UOO82602.1 hotdog fold thioesterase [Uruburuella testudinis]
MPQNPTVYRHLAEHYLSLPHCRAIDLQFERTEQRRPVLSIANRADLIGRSDNATIHGGAVCALIDVASACAVAAHLSDYEILATLDMRIDYMHPALTDRPVYARATCHRLAGQVAFVRTRCYQDDSRDPIALGTATFMRTPLGSREQQQLAEHLNRHNAGSVPLPAPASHAGADFTNDTAHSAAVAALMPYAAFIGLQSGHDHAGRRCYALPYKPELIGNIFLPALHGGLIGGFMESCAALYLHEQAGLDELPKMIDFSLDYLRSARAETAYARCILTRQGSRITNIAVEAWQSNEHKPFAVARCHFQMP